MEELIKTGTLVLAQFVELMAAVIVCFASAKAFAQFARDSFDRAQGGVPGMLIRLNLGKSLALAMELLLGADILKTAISPGWTEIGQLAAIAALRTALNYFLERELRSSEVRN